MQAIPGLAVRLTFGLLVLASTAPPTAMADQGADAPVNLRLAATADRAEPSRAFQLVALLEVAPGWALYWADTPQDGKALRFDFDLPEQLSLNDLVLSPPSRRLYDAPGRSSLLVEGRLAALAHLAASEPLRGPARIEVRVTYGALRIENGKIVERRAGRLQAAVDLAAAAKRSDAETKALLATAARLIPKRSGSTRAVSGIAAKANPPEVHPGEEVTVTVEFAVKPGLHIQAHKIPNLDLIPCDLFAVPAEGIIWQEPRFPAGKSRRVQYLGELLEYAGPVRITIPAKVLPDARPGDRKLRLILRYQACTDAGTCYPPEAVLVEAAVRILPGKPAGKSEQSAQQAAGVPSEEPAAAARSAGESAGPAPEQKAAPAAVGKTPPSQRAEFAAHLPWEPFSGRRLAELTAAGRTVLIDFTARWCINCKVIERAVLNRAETVELVRRNDVACLVADYTDYDPEIDKWLQKFGSISVPLTVIVPGRDPTRPLILRDMYTKATLLAALRKAGPSVDPAQAAGPLRLDTPIEVTAPTSGAWWYLLAGLLGGFLLNFMPCVLPVISIKVLSLLGQAGQSPRRVLGLGLTFAAGMLALFLALGVAVTLSGYAWGGWFQSRTFLLIMLGIVVAMAVSLFGAFTLTVPRAVGQADAAVAGEGYLGSFAKGVLAVLLGTPCSGPFLGVTMAWAAKEAGAGRPQAGLLVFASMGVGMALPFVILAAKPGWMRFIPKPGAWMETFKQFMGFLMLLTAVYLLYILDQWAIWAALYAFGVGFGCWMYGRLVRPGRSAVANWVGRGIAAAVIGGFAWISFVTLPNLAGPQTPSTAESRSYDDSPARLGSADAAAPHGAQRASKRAPAAEAD